MMETAKVDVRKLQLLNDRVIQCIEALNQVRLSVHGLSHTGIPTGYGAQVSPFAPVGQPGQISPFGLSHTGFAPQVPYAAQVPFAPQVPFYGAGFPQIQPMATPPWLGGAGLSHTGAEIGQVGQIGQLTDPFWAVRVLQTFPYLQYPVPGIS
jgi:hypothetical protein